MCIDPGGSYEKTAVERGGVAFHTSTPCPLCRLRNTFRHSSLVSVPDYQRPTLLHGSEGVRMHTNCHFVVSSFLLWDMGNLCAFVDLVEEGIGRRLCTYCCTAHRDCS